MNQTIIFKFKKNAINTLDMNLTRPKYDSYFISMIYKLKKFMILTKV
jgi:hypothetical protein